MNSSRHCSTASHRVYINSIATAVPNHEVHQMFIEEGPEFFFSDPRQRKIFSKLNKRGQIDQRYSVLGLGGGDEELRQFYMGQEWPATQARMEKYEKKAWPLAEQALQQLASCENLQDVTHVIVTSCTGFYAPGLDIEIVRRLGLKPDVERTLIGFMGCYAAFNALKQARSTLQSRPEAKVLMLNLELCTLHLKRSDDLEQAMAFSVFADGCAASVISTAPQGLELEGFYSTMSFESYDHITWRVGDQGFDMHLSSDVPKAISSFIPQVKEKILAGSPVEEVALWAIHPGGRAILDAVQKASVIPEEKMWSSREVLRRFGNMSSATVMFVLRDILQATKLHGRGCAMGFGPGLTVESLTFTKRPM